MGDFGENGSLFNVKVNNESIKALLLLLFINVFFTYIVFLIPYFSTYAFKDTYFLMIIIIPLIVVLIYYIRYLYYKINNVKTKQKPIITDVKSSDKYIIIISTSLIFWLYFLHKSSGNNLNIYYFEFHPFEFSLTLVADAFEFFMFVTKNADFALLDKIYVSLGLFTIFIGTIFIPLIVILVFFKEKVAKKLFLYLIIMLIGFNVFASFFHLSNLLKHDAPINIGFLIIIGDLYKILFFSLIFILLKKTR